MLPPLDDYRKLMPIITSIETDQARFLGELLIAYLQPQSVIDFGCGPGTYLIPYKQRGLVVLGLDAEQTAGHDLSETEFAHVDFRESTPLVLPQTYDLALCIEVGEHLQPQYAERIVQHCVNAAPLVFWSAAKPGQRGLFHYNEQHKSYWLELFSRHDYHIHHLDSAIHNELLGNPACQKVGWLIDNSMLLYKRIR